MVELISVYRLAVAPSSSGRNQTGMIGGESRQAYDTLLPSMILVSFNSGQLLLDCVNSVIEFTQNYELLVIDNESRDGSVERLNERFPDFAIVNGAT